MHKTNWDDFRYVLAVAEHGSFAAAARALGVNHTTVLRRLQAFEQARGVRVIDRRASGSALTLEGDALVATARQIEHLLTGLERSISGHDRKLEGTVRVTTTDSIFLGLLGDAFAAFQRQYPGIRLDLAITVGLLDLTRRDADVAIRPSLKPPEHLVGRNIGYLAFAVYASQDRMASIDRRRLGANPWIGLDAPLLGTPVGRWISAHVAPQEVVFQADTFLAIREAAVQGIGLAAMPCFLGDATPGLIRVTEPIRDMNNSLWILTHEDLRRATRVRVFMDFMADRLREAAPRLEGTLPVPAIRAGAARSPLPVPPIR